MSQERLPFSASGSSVFSVASSPSAGNDGSGDDFGDAGGRTPASPASATSEAIGTPASGHSAPPPVVRSRHGSRPVAPHGPR